MKIAQQIKQRLDAKRAEAANSHEAFASKRSEYVEQGLDLSAPEHRDKFDELNELNKAYLAVAGEARSLESDLMDALKMDDAKGDPSVDLPTNDPAKQRAAEQGIWTPGLRLVQNETYKNLRESGALTKSQGVEMPAIEIANVEETKALITGGSDTSGGAFVETDRQGYYPLLFAPSIRNLVTVGQTDSDLVEWVLEAAFTNAAIEVAEATATSGAGFDAGVKPESALSFQIVQSAVRTIAHWLPATKRALSDAGQLRTIIDQRLEDGVNQRLDRQMIQGNGAGENLRGILNTVGIGTVANGGVEPAVDTILRAITNVRLAFLEPNAVVVHPNDFVAMRLAKDADGNYIMGPPNLPGPNMLWGLQVVVSSAVPENTALVGKWDEAVLWVREGVSVSATDSHADFFTHNLVAILAEGRFAFGVPRPAAFCAATGI